jgi:hypothetical protein
MAEMVQFCGRQFRVSKRADNTCDTIEKYHARRMYRTVHLEQLRCDGCGHDSCQAGCLTFWKEAWLKRAQTTPDQVALVQIRLRNKSNGNGEDENEGLNELLARASRTTDEQGVRYFCQATELLRASEPLAWWDVRQYLRNIGTRNLSLAQFFRGYWFAAYAIVRRLLHAPHNFPYYCGPLSGATPTERLDLQPGELVQVKSRKEIYATLDGKAKNRGLYYDVEMWRFSGGTFRVLRRVDHIVNEKNGRMLKLSGCVILDGVYCAGERSTHRLFCQRNIYSYWREIWLRRAI